MRFQRREERTARVVVAVSTWELDEFSSSRGEASTVGDLDLCASSGRMFNYFTVVIITMLLTQGRIAIKGGD